METPDALLRELEALTEEIAELEDRISATDSPDDSGARRAALQRLLARKEAIEEEINQITGAAR